MALLYFDKDDVYERLAYFVEQEAEVLNGLEIRAALH
jgi:tRNA isopentenyl-2-thiomethyl-A-37 hydroxylase MiaE